MPPSPGPSWPKVRAAGFRSIGSPGRRRTASHPPRGTAAMSSPQGTAPLNVGFLTVLHEAGGYVGGYLVTNGWGRPLEFRLSTAVQPNRVQQILYAATL